MKNLDGKKVRITKKYLEWILTDEYKDFHTVPGRIEPDQSYHDMMDMAAQMIMDKENFPGTIVNMNPRTECYLVEYENGYRTWYERKNLIVKK